MYFPSWSSLTLRMPKKFLSEYIVFAFPLQTAAANMSAPTARPNLKGRELKLNIMRLAIMENPTMTTVEPPATFHASAPVRKVSSGRAKSNHLSWGLCMRPLPGLSRHERAMAIGYSATEVKTSGETMALKIPPRTPPMDIQSENPVRREPSG